MYRLKLTELIDKLKKREVTSQQATLSVLNHIEENKHINAYITVDREGAMQRAAFCDEQLSSGKDVPLLTGVPIAVKDNICVKGMPATSASLMLKDYYPPYNATITDKLIDSGAVILGKTNMDEFAMGNTNMTSYFGKVLNPINNDYTPGGSSGGSAAAVSADLAYAALGTDTGGSIRQPAAFCGVVGIKPTYGTVSRYGVTAFSSSLDQAGVVAKSVEDSAVVLQTISGYDEKDNTTQRLNNQDYYSNLKAEVKGKRIGIAKGFFKSYVDSDVKNAYERALKVFREAGAEIVDVTIPYIDESLSVYYIIACAEATSNLARFDGIKFGYRSEDAGNLNDVYYLSRTQSLGAEVKRRIMLGNYVLSSGYYDAYYLKAQKARTVIINAVNAAFNSCDMLISPTTPYTAQTFGHKFADPFKTYYSDVFTVLTNLAGIPSISVPCGIGDNGMPIGLQVIGKAFGEQEILNAAYFYQQAEGGKCNTK